MIKNIVLLASTMVGLCFTGSVFAANKTMLVTNAYTQTYCKGNYESGPPTSIFNTTNNKKYNVQIEVTAREGITTSTYYTNYIVDPATTVFVGCRQTKSLNTVTYSYRIVSEIEV